MIEDPTCCPPRVDTFLAVTKVKPVGPERPEKTEVEKREIERKLVECLNNPMKLKLRL